MLFIKYAKNDLEIEKNTNYLVISFLQIHFGD